jgi:hypothetical protein
MKRHLRLVLSNNGLNNTCADSRTGEGLFNAFCAALERWHSTKLESDRIAARNAYNAWAYAFLGEQESAAVKISTEQPWGFA